MTDTLDGMDGVALADLSDEDLATLAWHVGAELQRRRMFDLMAQHGTLAALEGILEREATERRNAFRVVRGGAPEPREGS